MDFPIESSVIKTAFDIAQWIGNEYQKRRMSRPDNDPQDDDRMDDCVVKTLYILRQESEVKKLEHIKCFAQNTILSDTCSLDTHTILRFLMDIEQMTWRQFCFLEGVQRMERNEIEIQGVNFSEVPGRLKRRDFEFLVNLGYLSHGNWYTGRSAWSSDTIRVETLGAHLAMLMDLKSMKIEEIVSAFGIGSITEITRH